jgi:helicase MOV-10
LVGDYIQIRRPGADSEPWYEGVVHAVFGKRVSLRFPDNFSTYRGNRFDVRFVLNRLPMRRMHQAVEVRGLQARVLFPTAQHNAPSSPPTLSQTGAVALVNRIIGGDEEQMTTILSIMNRMAGSIPFVLFGP